MNENSKSPRRVRYKGKHPRNFNEKYKELNPDKYSSDIEKIIQQGKTPAGMHRSICVNEIMEFLQLQPGMIGVDATLGYGGHSLEILKRITPRGKLYGLDVDSFELPKTTERLAKCGFGPESFISRHINFSEIEQIAEEAGLLNFVIADLGVSSMQIDNPDRGFSFKFDGPLDLRLNPNAVKTAADFLKSISQEELEEMLTENSDEPFAEVIAGTIISVRDNKVQIKTTFQLKEIISNALEQLNINKEEIKKSSQRTFQALRIAVNQEFDMLENFLDKLPDCLSPGGRVAILTFHSGEDRRVKKAFKYFEREGIYTEVAQSPIRPTAEECAANPRAKSAKLRWAIRA